MNYANMIEEKNLKKTFIIATLCSTLVGTFTSSIGLWDRVQDKRRQGKRDLKQEEAIKKLQERADKAEKERDEFRRGGGQSPRRRYDDDEVGDSFERSGALIQRQFDEGYGRLGSRFARGDTLTENQLQRQIIALQQTVIQVLQDALANDRQLTRSDMAKLVSASDAARQGSIEALRDQQQRLALDYDHDAPPPPSSRYLALQDRRSSPSPPPHQLARAPKRSSTIILQDTEPDSSLFCSYSAQLQANPHHPLSTSFSPSGPRTCPSCLTSLDIAPSDFWAIGKTTPIPTIRPDEVVMETREFHLGQRFVIKCHTRDGEFACVLCSRFRERDAICRTVEALVNHVGRFHEVGELERERDLREVAVVKEVEGRRGSVVGSVAGLREREREFR
ncbi:unnamed protein product [Periconia digitata]|uniref:Uncharacterized protein n=1 Tax=Periconia digitata TaxID=1303443 RepID=A0A9W4UII5_9PLEO|nr:unnamed protein product [Periconia digitata]